MVQGTGLGRPPLLSPILSPSRETLAPSSLHPVHVAVFTVIELTSACRWIHMSSSSLLTLPGLALQVASSREQM